MSIKIIKQSGQEIEIAGVRYVQRAYINHIRQSIHATGAWPAMFSLSLCDLLCQYCTERMVFAKKMEKR